MSGQERLFAGAMSGTSADGVDVAVVSITGKGLEMSAKLIQHHHVPYEPELKRLIFSARNDGSITLRDLANLGRKITLTYAAAINEVLAALQLSADAITAIAAHGQTLFHDPPNTIQWFDPSLLAAQSGCQIVSDFRRADCAAGGQGAPLVPFADFILFSHPTIHRGLINIGGIANITWLKAGGTIDEVIAFDTGPGNCVSDHVCRQAYPDGPGFDPQGQLSRMAAPSTAALQQLFAQPFFRIKPPRSTDAPAMIEMFESIQEMREAEFPVRISTATVFAVGAIELAITMFLRGKIDELIVSGGGTKNQMMMDHLRKWFGGNVKTSDELGLPSDAKEAVAFALLGAATIDGLPSNVPSVTGASRNAVLGSITPKL